MPEGDTIHNAAARLTRALAGKTVARFNTTSRQVGGARLVGRVVTSVTARGKFLSVHFDDGRVLVTHMRMTGAWHVYGPGERWQRGEHLARVVLAVDAHGEDPPMVAVCFAAPVIRLVTESEERRVLAHLGPDVVAAEFDGASASAVVARLRALGQEREIGEAIMDQRALAGVGNIFKSETLFAERVDPFARVGALDDGTLQRVVERAHVLMRRSVGRPRTTTSALSSTRYAVYLRARRPCPRCGYPIERAPQGRDRRSTYFCPRCQRGAATRSGTARVASDPSAAPTTATNRPMATRRPR